MNLSVILEPIINSLIDSLMILLLAMIPLAILIFAAKKMLYLLEISDYGLAQKERQQRQKELKRRQSNKISNNIFKTSQTKKERERREKLYAIKQFRKQMQEERRLKQSQLNRTRFENKKRAIELRENEKIKQAKRAVLNEKINGRFRPVQNVEELFKFNYKYERASERRARLKIDRFTPPQYRLNSRDFQGWKTQELKTFTKNIESSKNYKSHCVLDGGSTSVIVRTKNNEWHYYGYDKKGIKKQWSKIDDVEAKLTFDNNYNSSVYNKIK